MIEAVFIAAGLEYVLEKALEHTVGDAGKEAAHAVARTAWRELTGPEQPRNHDIARTVRRAQLDALEDVLGDYHRLRFDGWSRQGLAEPARFTERAVAFCRAQRGALARLEKSGAPVEFAAAGPLTTSVEGLLAPPPGPHAASRTDALDWFAEQAVLDELEADVAAAMPGDFPDFLRAGAPPAAPRFLDLFGERIAVRLKDKEDTRFRDMLTAGWMADLKLQGFETGEVLARIDAAFGVFRRTLDGVKADTAALRDGQAVQDAKLDAILAQLQHRPAEAGVPRATLRALVERAGGIGVADEDMPAWLDNWIATNRPDPGAGSNEGPEFAAAQREAQRRFDAGRLDAASQAFIDELDREDEAEQERQRERTRRSIRLLEEAIVWDKRALNPDAAVDKMRRIAALRHPDDPEAQTRSLYDQAAAFDGEGAARGDNSALLIAIAGFRAVLATWTHERAPKAWARTQVYLGISLWRLGERESGTARLTEAVAAYRAGLEELTRERVPLQWAATQNNLGAALRTLGERESGTARLTDSVAAFRAALEEFTRGRVPLQWAATQNNVGNALRTLGERESGTARLTEAVAAYRAALEEYTRERVPLDWAMTQNNLGGALKTLGERESGTARLAEAVAAFRAALEERTRERVPLDWATTQNNLGNALRTLGERESGTARLTETVAAFRAALEECTRERVPLDWATTQNNLGNVLAVLGERESSTARLTEAVAAYRAGLEELTRERVPLQWAATQNNLGNALRTLGERESGTARLTDSVAAFRAALEEYTRERVPLHWAMTQNNLGNALQALGERESGIARLTEAVAAYRAALEERTSERVPLQWAATQNNLANTLALLATRTQNVAQMREAIEALRAAAEVYREGGNSYRLPVAERRLAELEAELAKLGTERRMREPDPGPVARQTFGEIPRTFLGQIN